MKGMPCSSAVAQPTWEREGSGSEAPSKKGTPAHGSESRRDLEVGRPKKKAKVGTQKVSDGLANYGMATLGMGESGGSL